MSASGDLSDREAESSPDDSGHSESDFQDEHPSRRAKIAAFWSKIESNVVSTSEEYSLSESDNLSSFSESEDGDPELKDSPQDGEEQKTLSDDAASSQDISECEIETDFFDGAFNRVLLARIKETGNYRITYNKHAANVLSTIANMSNLMIDGDKTAADDELEVLFYDLESFASRTLIAQHELLNQIALLMTNQKLTVKFATDEKAILPPPVFSNMPTLPNPTQTYRLLASQRDQNVLFLVELWWVFVESAMPVLTEEHIRKFRTATYEKFKFKSHADYFRLKPKSHHKTIAPAPVNPYADLECEEFETRIYDLQIIEPHELADGFIVPDDDDGIVYNCVEKTSEFMDEFELSDVEVKDYDDEDDSDDEVEKDQSVEHDVKLHHSEHLSGDDEESQNSIELGAPSQSCQPEPVRIVVKDEPAVAIESSEDPLRGCSSKASYHAKKAMSSLCDPDLTQEELYDNMESLCLQSRALLADARVMQEEKKLAAVASAASLSSKYRTPRFRKMRMHRQHIRKSATTWRSKNSDAPKNRRPKHETSFTLLDDEELAKIKDFCEEFEEGLTPKYVYYDNLKEILKIPFYVHGVRLGKDFLKQLLESGIVVYEHGKLIDTTSDDLVYIPTGPKFENRRGDSTHDELIREQQRLAHNLHDARQISALMLQFLTDEAQRTILVNNLQTVEDNLFDASELSDEVSAQRMQESYQCLREFYTHAYSIMSGNPSPDESSVLPEIPESDHRRRHF